MFVWENGGVFVVEENSFNFVHHLFLLMATCILPNVYCVFLLIFVVVRLSVGSLSLFLRTTVRSLFLVIECVEAESHRLST